MSLGKKIGLSITFVAIGFLGAAIRYWRWWPSHSDVYYTFAYFACPLCPNVDSMGPDLQKFVGRTTFGGLLNILPVLMCGWLVMYAVQSVRRSRHS